MGARYEVDWADREITLRARVDNVTDKSYRASVGGSFGANYLVLGAPRTFIVSASLNFYHKAAQSRCADALLASAGVFCRKK